MRSRETLRRAVPVVAALAGLAHLLVPERLLATAEWGYDRMLAVDFEPRERATRRVRILGVGFLAVAWLAARPAGED